MSTAFYPTNMRQQPASGYNHNSTYQNIPYRPWKGTGIFSNPVGVTSTHIRPLTNLDPGNVFPTGFGLPRPIKHYRKGTVIPIPFAVITVNPEKPSEYIEKSLIAFNTNRAVQSSIGSSLGGGNGGTGLISQLIDMPGSFIVKDNQPTDKNDGVGLANILGEQDGSNIDKGCLDCRGVGLVSGWYPINNLTEKPEPSVMNPLLCCNQPRKAIQRVLPANTLLKKNYFQTTYMYLYNRCQTFQQRQFNFIRGPVDIEILNLFSKYPFVTAKILEYTKPGDPLAIVNQYVAQCNPNFTIETGIELAYIQSLSRSLLNAKFITIDDYNALAGQSPETVTTFVDTLQKLLSKEQYALIIAYLYELTSNPYNGSVFSGPSNPRGCTKVYYKPNNPQFAKQGGVSSSTRILKLNVDTISTTAAINRRLKGANAAIDLTNGQIPVTPYIYKDKVPPCTPATYIGNPFFFNGQHQNKLICRTNGRGDEYRTYNTIFSGTAGNYIGATQAGGKPYSIKDSISSYSYYDNIQNSPLYNYASGIN